jgi:hypothetical protein
LPIVPKNGLFAGGVVSSGIFGLGGNYANLPHQVKASFTLRFVRPGTYTYYCLVHGPLMKGTITVLPAIGGDNGQPVGAYCIRPGLLHRP